MDKANRSVAERQTQSPKSEAVMHPTTDIVEYARNYCREKPEVAALWCLGIGFVLGWKLKLW